jgi:hypothetical protein
VTRAAGERAEDEHIESSGKEIVSHRLSMEAYGGVSVKNLPIDRQWDAGFRGSLNPPPIAKTDGACCLRFDCDCLKPDCQLSVPIRTNEVDFLHFV